VPDSDALKLYKIQERVREWQEKNPVDMVMTAASYMCIIADIVEGRDTPDLDSQD
jgi:hypothetical protein